MEIPTFAENKLFQNEYYALLLKNVYLDIIYILSQLGAVVFRGQEVLNILVFLRV